LALLALIAAREMAIESTDDLTGVAMASAIANGNTNVTVEVYGTELFYF
jgi:hypothetical protein